MATTERYTTVIELNSEQAKRNLDELRKKVESWKSDLAEAREKKMGKSFIAAIRKELSDAEKELGKYDSEVARTIETMNNLGEASVERVEEAQRSLTRLAKEVPHDDDPDSFYSKLNNMLGEVNQELENIRNTKAFEQMQREASGATKSAEQMERELAFIKQTAENAATASVKQLQMAEKTAESIRNSSQKGSKNWTDANDGLEKVRARLTAIDEEERKVVRTIDKYDKEIKEANKSIEVTQRETKLIDATLDNLSSASIRDIEYSIKLLNEQLRDTERTGGNVKEITDKLKELNKELKKVQDMQNPPKEKGSIFSRMIEGLNNNWGAITQITSAITGLSTTVRGCVQSFAEMDQEMYNVTKYTGWTIEQVKRLNEDFRKMDTRTSREQLNQLAQAAGRLGITSEEGVKDFVDAADKIGVALGDDLGQGAVDAIGKLAMAFGEDDRLGLRGAMLATGSAINELAQNSAANAGYLVDFTARLSGVGKQAGLTQSQILGIAAAMDENMQKDEMAATAISQIITKMTTDSEVFARIAGKNVEEFATLVKTDMNAALMQFFEAMNRKGGFTELAPLFEQMGLDGTRAIGVLSTLASKIDDVRSHQQLATEAYRQQKSVLDEFNVQNTTYQARLEKARKAFNDLKVELGEKLLPVVQYTISGAGTLTRIIATVAGFFTKNIATTITLTAAIAALTVAIEGQIIKQKLLAFWNGKVKKSLDALFTTISKHPFLFLAAGIAMVVARLIDMRRESESAITAQKAMEAASKKASDGFMEEEVRVKQLSKQVHDNKLALDLRRQALEQLKGIIPGYNALLDEEGRLTRDNTAAIDEYLKRRKQELLLKAYEEELVEAYKQQAKANEALSGMIEMYKAGSNWGWAKQSMFSRIKQEAIDANNAVAALEKAMEEAQHSLSKSMASPAGGDSYESGGSAATSQPENYNTRSYWEQELKRRQDHLSQLREDASSTAEMIEEASKKVKEAEEKMELFTGAKHEALEQRQEEHDRRERQRKANDAAKAETEQQVAELTHRYATGKVLYCDYVDEQERIQIEGIERRMLIYEEESLEYQKLARQREELLLNGSEERQKLTLAQMKVEHEQRLDIIREQALRENKTEQQKNEMVFREDMRFMDEQRILYRKGTLERINLERDIEERQQEHRLEQQQYYQQQLLQTREQLLQMGSERLMELELNNIDKVYDEMIRQGVAKEEERHEAILAVRAKYANYQSTTERDQQKASQMLSVARSDAKQKLDNQSSPSASIPFVGTIVQYQATMERLKELYGNDEQNHAAYLAAKQQATAQFCQELAAEMQAAYNTVNQVMQAASSYFSAQQEYETTIVQKKYEKQIDAAGNNQKKVKKLQEQQQKEEATIKTKYAKRAAAIQYAQAVATTAMNAIQAYGAVLQPANPASYVYAAIAAAAALAAGMLQIATIKKQQQAQQAGYYEGGFTHGRRYRKEAGVVHEGEFVANHQAVENPAILPFLNFIDQAQRNNTVGSLSMQDVSRALSVGGGSAVAPITPIVNVQTDNEELRDAVKAHREATELLLMRLEQPINAQVVLTGPDGLNEQQRRLNNMMKNK